MNKIKKTDILDKAKLTLEDLFKDEVTLSDKDWTSNNDTGADGHLLFNGIEFPFITLPQPTTGKIVRSVNKLSKEKKTLFILDYASPEMINFLRTNKLFFVDTAGNCYVNLPDFKIVIEGRKNVSGKLPDTKVAFQKTGLKLIYQLLIEPELVCENYRTIASKTGISLASVSNIFEELQEDKFIAGTNKKRSLSRVERLVTKWAMGYEDVLRPKIHRGYFRALNPDIKTLMETNVENNIYFGGQYGAYFLNNSITAQDPILFSNIRLGEMVRKYKIVPFNRPEYSQQKRIEVLEVFWNTEQLKGNKSKKANIVDPILIYADLMISNDFRSIETANNILDNEIRNKFIQYQLLW